MYEILFYEDEERPITIYRFSDVKAGRRAFEELKIAHPTEEFEGREAHLDNYVGPIWRFIYDYTDDTIIGVVPDYDPNNIGHRGEFVTSEGHKCFWGFVVAYSREHAVRKIVKEFSA